MEFDDKKIYNVNSVLEHGIFSMIPKNFNNLEQAIAIYYQLCRKLQYSLAYFLDNKGCGGKFTTADNIEKVDGIKNKDVVCYTFDRIFLKMLYDRKLISQNDFWNNVVYDINCGVFPPLHNVPEFTIDGKVYNADATYGIFRDCDLTMLKFPGQLVNGWRIAPISHSRENVDELDNATEKVRNAFKTKFEDSIDFYVRCKEGNFQDFSLDIRMNLFLSCILKNASYSSINSLAYAYQLKHILFTSDETRRYGENSLQKVAVSFVQNTNTKCASIIVVYNVGSEVKAYQIDLQAKKYEKAKAWRTTVENLKIKEKRNLIRKAGEEIEPLDWSIELVESAAQNCREEHIV